MSLRQLQLNLFRIEIQYRLGLSIYQIEPIWILLVPNLELIAE
jgi:hypothetical protein